jgi:hypothetical protein
MVIFRSFTSVIYAIILTILVLSTVVIGYAQVRTSPSYQLQSDSINIGGGLSSSTSYVQESTIGEIATGRATSSSYSLFAGYQQMQAVFLSLAVTGNVAMSPDLPGLTGGTSNGSTTFTVTTDSPSGYQITIAAENTPAMQSANGNFISDYNAGANADFSFITGGSEAHLGFSPEGSDVVQDFLDNGAACGIGSGNASLACWEGLSTSDTVLASAPGSNHPSGATTTLHFRVGIGSGAGVPTGVYTATTTVTALPL